MLLNVFRCLLSDNASDAIAGSSRDAPISSYNDGGRSNMIMLPTRQPAGWFSNKTITYDSSASKVEEERNNNAVSNTDNFQPMSSLSCTIPADYESK